MNDPAVGALGGIYLFVVIFMIVLAILWFFLPFAIFGTKGKLDTLIAEMRDMNDQLEELQELLSRGSQPEQMTTQEPASDQRLSHDQLMAKYGISNDGEKYIFQGHRYDRLEDAAAYAREQTSS